VFLRRCAVLSVSGDVAIPYATLMSAELRWFGFQVFFAANSSA